MTALVRFLRRKASTETRDAAQFRDTELRNKDGSYDLRPSVYEIEPQSELVQACAEHVAAAEMDPPTTMRAVDLSTLGVPHHATPGQRQFAFIHGRHREMLVADPNALLELVEALISQMTSRAYETRKAEVKDYVRTRLLAGDKEWTSMDDLDWVAKLAR